MGNLLSFTNLIYKVAPTGHMYLLLFALWQGRLFKGNKQKSSANILLDIQQERWEKRKFSISLASSQPPYSYPIPWWLQPSTQGAQPFWQWHTNGHILCRAPFGDSDQHASIWVPALPKPPETWGSMSGS